MATNRIGKEEWITAAEAARLLKPVFDSEFMARQTICKRAHGGLIRAHAEQFTVNKNVQKNFEIPKDFWWAEGGNALHQNWPSGDFDTWIDRGEVHLQAFSVSFLRADIEKIIPADMHAPAAPVVAPSATSAAAGGRPPADWWEDLLIDVCFQHFRGDLKPKSQADVERAMRQWITDHGSRITDHGRDAADSTIRIRARKVWQTIQARGRKLGFCPFPPVPGRRTRSGPQQSPQLIRCVAALSDVMTLAGLTPIVERPPMKPTDLIALLPAVNNGWAFAAFVIVLVVSLYCRRRDEG